jgi:hypothetical protein
MAVFYEEVTVAANFAADGGRDFGFTATGVRFELQSGGPVDYSFDGTTVHGTLGPSGTRVMINQLEGGSFGSGVWLKGAATPVCSVQAWD